MILNLINRGLQTLHSPRHLQHLWHCTDLSKVRNPTVSCGNWVVTLIVKTWSCVKLKKASERSMNLNISVSNLLDLVVRRHKQKLVAFCWIYPEACMTDTWGEASGSGCLVSPCNSPAGRTISTPIFTSTPVELWQEESAICGWNSPVTSSSTSSASHVGDYASQPACLHSLDVTAPSGPLFFPLGPADKEPGLYFFSTVLGGNGESSPLT